MKHIIIDARIRRASTGRYVDRLIEHLQNLDTVNKYTVLINSSDPWRAKSANFKHYYCDFPQFSFNPIDQLFFAWQLYKLRADLVFFPMNQQPLLYFKTTVTAVMDLTMLRFTRPGKHSKVFHFLRMQAYRFLFWYSLRKSIHILTISNFVKNDILDNYPFTKDKITTTYCASEPPISAMPVILKSITKPFIFHVGSPFPHKNIDRLVDAFVRLKKQNSELQLVLSGKKEFYFEELIKEIKKLPSKIQKDIHVTGFVSDPELRWLYENAECYVLPSLSEGFGLPGLEAMVHGCPVVSSNATCLPEIYGEAAHYFNPTSVDDMQNKIQEVLDDKKLRNKLIKKGYTQIKKYSWEKMAKETLEVYKKALE